MVNENGKQMIIDLEFEEKIRDFSKAEQFLARELYDQKKNCIAHNSLLQEHEMRLDKMETGQCASCPRDTPQMVVSGKKQLVTNAASGGVAGVVVSIIITLVEYFRRGS